MAQQIELINPIKIITSGKVPVYDENLSKGQIAIGKVNKHTALYAALDSSIIENVLEYDSAEKDESTTMNDIGGIPKGTKASELKGKPVSEILDSIFFPLVYPTFVQPSVSIAFKSTSSTPSIQEVGTTGSSVPVESSFNVTFNRGEVKINDQKTQDYSGEMSSSEIQCQENSGGWTASLSSTIPEGKISYKVIANYGEGEQPLDSKGNAYGSPLEAGSVTSTTISITGVYPYFANTVSSNTLTKLPLVSGNSFEASCVAETNEGRHQFSIPSKYTVTKIEFFDTNSNTYQNMSMSKFDSSTYNQDVQSAQIEYKKYTRNEESKSGATKFRITFTKS